MGEPGAKRLMIRQMVLDNFKSYAGPQYVGPFHKVKAATQPEAAGILDHPVTGPSFPCSVSRQ